MRLEAEGSVSVAQPGGDLGVHVVSSCVSLTVSAVQEEDLFREARGSEDSCVTTLVGPDAGEAGGVGGRSARGWCSGVGCLRVCASVRRQVYGGVVPPIREANDAAC